MTTETSNARGEWIREWQGSGPQRGFHIRETTRLHNNRVIALIEKERDAYERSYSIPALAAALTGERNG